MRIRILQVALNDLAAGRKFYERQAEGIGDYFLDSVFADIDSLAFYGGIHLLQFGYHRKLTKRFPYAIYYHVIDGVVVIYRVLDCRRNPRSIRKALSNE